MYPPDSAHRLLYIERIAPRQALPQTPNPAAGLNQSATRWELAAFFRGMKLPEFKAYLLPQSGTEVKNVWSCIY
jgi:hypothetical protein